MVSKPKYNDDLIEDDFPLDEEGPSASNDEIGDDNYQEEKPTKSKKGGKSPSKSGSNKTIAIAVAGAVVAVGGFLYISSIGKSPAPMPEVQTLPTETLPISQAPQQDMNSVGQEGSIGSGEVYDPNGIAEPEPVLSQSEMAAAQASEQAMAQPTAEQQPALPTQQVQAPVQAAVVQPTQAAQSPVAAPVAQKTADGTKIVYAESISPSYPKAPPKPAEAAPQAPAPMMAAYPTANISFPESESIAVSGGATQQKIAVLEARLSQFEQVLNAMGYKFTKFEVEKPKKAYVAPVKKPVVKTVSVKKPEAGAIVKKSKIETEENLGQIDPLTGLPAAGNEKDKENFIKIKEQEAKLAEAQISIKPAAMSLYAVIPGRAWIRDANGNRYTVTVGESLPGYGQVTAINPEQGQVLTNGGSIH